PYLAIVVANNESREVVLKERGIEFTEEVRLNPKADQGFTGLLMLNEPKVILRPGGNTSLALPVEFNSVVLAFCTGKVKGVYVEDDQNFKAYAPLKELDKTAQYFEKFFRNLDIDELRMRYSTFL